MALTDKYPIDISALHKGQLLTPEQLQQITGKKPADQTVFAFALLALREFIQENTDFTVKLTTEGMRILTDAEAAEYNHRRFRGHLTGLVRRYERNAVVDVAGLSPPDARKHTQDLVNESRYLGAMSTVSKKIAVDSHRRTLPGPRADRIRAKAERPPSEPEEDNNGS